jgi:aspartyl/asparaginyl beta-hydroxylase (cupin superfamily)
MGKFNKNTTLFRTIFFIAIIVIFILIICGEMDRTFNSKNAKDNYTIKGYYFDSFPLVIIGCYNVLIRATHPSHTHKFNTHKFKSDHILKQNYKLIQQEAVNVYKDKNKSLMNMSDLSESAFNRIDSEKNLWKVYVLKWYDKINDAARVTCPNTCNLIDQCPDIHAAMFSILEPGKYIPPHKGPSTVCLRYHLGLKIPKDKHNCYIMVNNEKFHWQEGESLIFDDTYVHSVHNNTKEPRIILFVDILRPTNSVATFISNFLISQSGFNNFVKGINDAVEKKQNVDS